MADEPYQGRRRYTLPRSDGGFVAGLWMEMDASLPPEAQLAAVRELFQLVIGGLEKEIEGRGTKGGDA